MKKKNIKGFIVAVLEKNGEKQVFETHNIVTNDGDIYYAERGAGQTPTNAFSSNVLGTGVGTPAKADTFASLTVISGSEKAISATYPKTNDSDTDNTGATPDTVSYLYEYSGADGDWSNITEGAIVVPGASGSDPILCHYAFSSAFNKDSNTTLKLFVNHTANGV